MDIESAIWRQRIFGVYKSVDTKKTDEQLFMDIASKVSERYSDYVLIIRGSDGGRAWKFSDANWAYGACSRVIAGIDSDDFKNAMEDEDGAR